MCSSAYGVRVAVIMKLDDPYAKYPRDMLNAMKFRLSQEKNKQIVTLKEFSHNGDIDSIEKAIVAARRYNPQIVVGGETSQFAMIIARAFKDVVFISPTASTYLLNHVHPAPIRMVHSDDQYTEIIKHLKQVNLLGTTVGVFHNTSYPNSNRISLKTIELLKENNVRPVVVEYINGEEITYSKLKSFIEKKITSIVIFSYDSDLRKVVSVLKKENVHPLYIGADGWGRDDFLRENLLKKESKFRGIRSMYWDDRRKDHFFSTTILNMERALGKKVDAFQAIGYDTMEVILVTLKNGSLKNFNNILKAKKYNNILTSKVVSFNEDLHVRKDLYLYELKDSGINFFSKIRPE